MANNINRLFTLIDKVVLITGGYGLFGKPMSRALAEAGAKVIIASRNAALCEEYSKELRSAGLDTHGYGLDLSCESSIKEVVGQIVEEFGQIDILVNNAVSRDGFKNLADMSKEEWENAQRINSTGTMLLTQAVLSDMQKRGSGNIINIGSIQSVVGPNFEVYGQTGMTSPVNYTYDKWAIVGFTKWIANYYGKYGIRANCLSPGGYGPGVANSFGETEFTQNYRRLTPMGRFADDKDIMGPIIFLASDASSYMTGHNLVVDGGWSSW